MKKTKKWLFSIAAIVASILGSTTNLRAEEKFYIPNFEISAGETKDLAIQFESEKVNDYVAFQFDLYLPDGLSVVQKKGKYNFQFNEDRYDDHTFTYSVQNDGAIRVIAVSLTNSNFWEESGDFVYFSVTASDVFSGTHEISLKNIMFSTKEGARSNLSNTKTTVTGPTSDNENEGEATLYITSANKWATCILPFSTELPSGVKGYTSGSIKDDFLCLNEVSYLEANTPYILYAEEGYEGTLSGNIESINEVVITDGLLSGALAEQTITNGYVLQNQGSGSMFYKVNGQITIPTGKCWLNVGGKRNAIRILNNTTGIDSAEEPESDRKIYTLDGKIVTNPQNGKVYVVNGKKVMKL